ncbi:MAG: hypothetical protein P1V97_12190 [Planctomycetota bacterium]|nr:hypothetical protein [Planctomycetota bacterium]
MGEEAEITAGRETQDSTEENQKLWADRGWYLAVEYGLLPGKERFLKRLEKIRDLGTFKELLESGGSITYRNLFRQTELQDAWALMTAVQSWKKKVTLYLNGRPLDWKDASQIVWCGGYLEKENPCRGDASARRYDVGCNNKLNFAPFQFDRVEDSRRHIMTFAELRSDAHYHFDCDAIRDFLSEGDCAKYCPLSPARQNLPLEEMFQPLSTQKLGWQVVLRMSKELERKLGAAALKRDHAFQKSSSASSMIGPMPLEINEVGGQASLFLANDPSGPPVSSGEVDITVRVQRALDEGIRLRAIRKGERYCRAAGRRDEIEQVFNLEPMFVLDPDRDPAEFPGFELESLPQNNPGYQAWVKNAMKCFQLHDSEE